MIMDIGPFRFYRVRSSGSLCISLISEDDRPYSPDSWSYGFEYGWADPAACNREPLLSIRVRKLQLFYIELSFTFVEIWLFGFWAMKSLDKKAKS